MPLLLIGTGIIFLLTGLNGDVGQLYGLVAGDFSGPGNFIYWLTSIVILGAIGYIKGLENISRAFLVLVVVGLLLDNGGFFTQFNAFIKSQAQPQTTTQT
jgi:hypothetical protein